MNEYEIKYREFTQQRLEDFISKGYKQKYFFPHKVFHLPKCGPDGLKMASRMCNINNPNQLWEIILYATGPVLREFPDKLFFDDDIIWHQQQLGKKGQVATVNLVVSDNRLYTMNHLSDLVQRISRRREYKTRIENRFKGWHHLLLNSILSFALENDLQTVFAPTSDFVIKHTDPKRTVKRELFDRIYDRAVLCHFQAVRKDEWWQIDVRKNADKIITPENNSDFIKREKIICLAHDIEEGLGHVNEDPKFSVNADHTSNQNLKEMLSIEKEMDLSATYFVVGCLMNKIREKIEQDGHCIGFHSYDHDMNKDQLPMCREIDYRIKGYRPPQSKITTELSDENLCFFNFEWLASSSYSFDKIKLPFIQNRIVKIPILFDDFEMYQKQVNYKDWEHNAIKSIEENEFVAFCLHDCYAHYWLPHYRKFLNKICGMGEFKTMNEVANEMILCSSL